MAQRISAARLALWISVLLVVAGIYMLWRHTQSLVQRDARKPDGTMLILPAHHGELPSPAGVS